LKFAGYNVVSVILYNDRGIHICKSMLAYQKWGEDKTPAELNLKPDHMIGKYYVMFNEKAEQDENLNEEVSLMLKKWEDGDEEVRELWKKMNGWFFDGIWQTLGRVGIEFEKTYLESEIYHFGREIVENALKQGKAYKLEDGAVEVDLTDVNLDKKILLRRDGTTVYMIQDLYLAQKKIDDLNLDKSIYVVATEQKYHFDVLFELLDRFGISDKSKNYHLAYAMVNTASGKKMSSRQGTGEKWDELLDELHDLAEKEILTRESDIAREEIDKRAELIGQSALKFVLLNQDVNKAISFDKEEAVRFDGETGPYLLYTYARINSILGKTDVSDSNILEIENEVMNEIFLHCARLPEMVERAAREYNPSVISHYLFHLSQLINNFYHQYRVLDEPDEAKKNSRIVMLVATKQVMKNCFGMLGIEELEKM
jgi:arginyl-tRNA synthetase